MTFSLKNYNALYAEPDFFENNDPANGDTIATANLADFKTLGLLSSDSFYKIEPAQTGRSSLGEEVVYTEKLALELKIMSDLTPEKLAQLENKIKSIALAPKEIAIPEDATDLSSNGVVIPSGAKIILFKGATLKITEDVKMGTLEVIPITISAEIIAASKSGLKKEFGFTLS